MTTSHPILAALRFWSRVMHERRTLNQTLCGAQAGSHRLNYREASGGKKKHEYSTSCTHTRALLPTDSVNGCAHTYEQQWCKPQKWLISKNAQAGVHSDTHT